MAALRTLAEIADLYAIHGSRHYGEGVTQIEHALQCAALAEAENAGPSLIVAALLHDVGHLLDAEEAVVGAASDRRHEAIGAAALAALFGPAVRAPIVLHVAAKRYLCALDPAYHAGLSAASRHSLVLQGGAMEAAEQARFRRRPFWREAVTLRGFDDGGKSAERSGRRFADYLPMMARIAFPEAPSHP